MTILTSAAVLQKLQSLASPTEVAKYNRYFKTGKGEYAEGDIFVGVRMGKVFALAKEFIEMPLVEVEQLLDSPIHEARAVAISLINQLARKKKTPEDKRQAMYELYLRKHDRINNWDLVDLGAPYVVGGYLFEYKKPRSILYKLVTSKNIWERRTSMVGTFYFLKKGEVEDTLKIAEILLSDKHDLIHKAVGWGLRVVGDVDRSALLKFLDKHAATMPRTALRYSLEHFDKDQRQHYMGLKRK